MSRGLWFQSGAVLGASGSDYSLIQLIMKEAWEGSLGWRWGKGSPWKGAERQASHGGWRVDTQPSACPTKQVGPMRKAKDLSPQKHTHTHSLSYAHTNGDENADREKSHPREEPGRTCRHGHMTLFYRIPQRSQVLCALQGKHPNATEAAKARLLDANPGSIISG